MRGNFLKTLGPGILFASTAIGVSHLVQSTRAVAEYGLAMLIFIILVNVMKYPFFEFGSRYTNITKDITIDKQPPLYLKFLSIFGICFLLAFSSIFLIYV